MRQSGKQKADPRRASGAPAPGRQGRRGSRSGVYLILGGLVVTGIIAGYNWLQSLRRY